MKRDTALVCLGLPLICLAVYWNSLGNAFHYDDIHSIVDNPSIRSLDNTPSYFKYISTFSADVDRGMYRPLLLVSYALNHALGEYDVQGYRLLNILLHGVNACLVAWLTRQLCPRRREAALIAGLLFAVHPLATEPVNYISSRSESLAAMLYLLTMTLFFRARERHPPVHPYGAWVAFELGLLTKMTVVTAPLVLLLYEFVRGGIRSNRELVRRQAPFWVILLIHTGVVINNGYLTRSLGEPVRDHLTQVLTQLKAVGYYLYMVIAPVHLNVEHQFSVQKQMGPVVMMSVALILTSFWLAWFLYRRGGFNSAVFSTAWAVLVVLPVMAMPLNVLVNERRLYLPVAAFCLLLGILLSRWYREYAAAQGRRITPLLLVAVLVLSMICVQRNRVWADDFTLWGDVVDKAPLMPRGHLYLGNAHKDAALASSRSSAGQHWKAAAAQYQRVIDLKSDRALSLRALNNLGSILLSLGELEDAEGLFRQAVDLDPDYVDARVNLGVIYLELSRGRSGGGRMLALRQSIAAFEHAVSVSPNHWQAFGNLGVAYQDHGDLAKARQAYEQAVFLKGDDTMTLKNLAVLHAQLAAAPSRSDSEARQHLVKAREYLHRALHAAPGHRAVRSALNSVEQQLERLGS